MQFLHYSLLVGLLLGAVALSGQTLHFSNAKYYDGAQFVEGDLYSVDGQFQIEISTEPDTVIDMQGSYLVPPLAEGHTHNLDRTWQMNSIVPKYLNEGVFYAQVLTNKVSGRRAVEDKFASPSTMDVRYSNAGITSTLGHPFGAYEPYVQGFGTREAQREHYDELLQSRGDEGNSYLFMDNLGEAIGKMDDFLATDPQLVKVYLLNTERYDSLTNNAYYGDSGLQPSVVAYVVERAHDAGLEVYAHINTAYDFEVALRCGVDAFAHMPGVGYSGKEEDYEQNYVSDSLLQVALDQDVAITPTLVIGSYRSRTDEEQKKYIDFQRDFVQRFVRGGGRLLIGSDIFNSTLSAELEYWIDNAFFTPQELLRLTTEVTPQAIFPDRKIGRIAPGYEASLIALPRNPLEDPSALLEVGLKVKQGYLLE